MKLVFENIFSKSIKSRFNFDMRGIKKDLSLIKKI